MIFVVALYLLLPSFLPTNSHAHTYTHASIQHSSFTVQFLLLKTSNSHFLVTTLVD